jgi:hypothetical protein
LAARPALLPGETISPRATTGSPLPCRTATRLRLRASGPGSALAATSASKRCALMGEQVQSSQ